MGEKVSKKKRERSEAEAKAKEQKSNQTYFLGMIVVMCILVWGAGYLFNGATVNTLPDKMKSYKSLLWTAAAAMRQKWLAMSSL